MVEWWEGFWATYNTVVFSIGVNAMLALSIYLTLACGMLTCMALGAAAWALFVNASGGNASRALQALR